MATKVSTRDHWEKFWQERKDIDQVYSNDERIYQNLKKVTKFENKKILEVGAGSGRDSLKLYRDKAQVFVLDYAPQSLEIIRQLNKKETAQLHGIQADAFRMPFPDNSFDIVFHQGLLEHFRDPRPLLQENFRILKPGGLLLVDVPQRYHFYTVIKHILIFLNKWFAGWETEFSVRELKQVMQKSGFEPIHSYGNWMRPSLFYRIFREVLKKVGIQLPLYPRGFSPFRRIRDKFRSLFSGQKGAFYTFLDIGVIGEKKEKF
ncbi:MAG: class I SAM-dependent methyltransferase [Calditrichaeota bacterium]|nr:class I SAM-dependent methyltransferase [Calditrichota bacterium]